MYIDNSCRTLTFLLAFTAFIYSTAWAKAMKSKDYFHDIKQQSLAEAAAAGRLSEVESLIHDGVDVNYQGAEGMTVLIWAFLKQNRRGYEYLLDKGANPNLRMTESRMTSDGITNGASVMTLAAGHEDPWFLAVALKHGGDANLENVVKGTTPVFECISLFERSRPNLRMENLRLLIGAGAKLNGFNKGGLTPMMYAAIVNRFDMVFVMLEAGADPKLASTPRKTLVYFIKESRTDPASEAYKWRARVVDELKSKGVVVGETN